MFQELTRSRTNECVSDLQLDAWFADELDPDLVGSLEAHIKACDRCRARRGSLADARAEFLLRWPLAPAVPARVKRPRSWAWSGSAVSMLAAAAVVLLVLWKDPEEAGTRTKGKDQIGFFVKHGEQVREGYADMEISRGDSLRFVHSTNEKRYLAVISRDAQGQCSTYFPSDAIAVAVGPGQNIPLPVSVELDETLGPEKIYAVFCGQPFAVEHYLQQLRMGRATLEADSGCTVRMMRLFKK